MRPSDDVPRLLECGNAMLLVAQASHLATRVYLTLFWGDGSEKPGFGRCGPGELADVLASSRRAIVAALNELQALGLIAWSEDERLAYRPGFAAKFNPRDWPAHTHWLNTADRLRDGLIRAQVIADIGPRREPTSKAASQAASEAGSQGLSAPSTSSISSPSEIVAPQGKPAPAAKVKAPRTAGQTPPTTAETRAVFVALGCPDDRLGRIADQCHDYWLSKGWKRGNTPIRDWPATCRTWWRNECERNPMLARQRSIVTTTNDDDYTEPF